MYAAHLPHPEKLRPELRVKFFRAHETFAAYLQVWADMGFSITWPDAHIASIGAQASTAELQEQKEASADMVAAFRRSAKIWQSALLAAPPAFPSLDQVSDNGVSCGEVTA